MADINYIHYGNEQIDQLALLNSLANNVLNYVASLPWSRRRKEKFMSAYSDILSKGVLGASNDTGQWMIDVGGNVDLDSISKKDKEMYLEAAYFILQQMASLPTLTKEEEEKKEELPVLTNSLFQKDFGTFLTNLEFGGSKERLASGWKGLDTVRDAEGKLSTKVRRNTLANALEGYRNSLKDNQYNFEGSPFVDLNTFKTRLDDAIAAIRSDDPNDDNVAFNRLGLNASDWFDTGLNDNSGKVDSSGNPLTYGQLNAIKQATLKLTTTEKSLKAAAPRYTITRSNPKMSGKTPQLLKEIYKDDNGLRTALQSYLLNIIGNLTPDQLSELTGIYKYLAKDPIDSETFRILTKSKFYTGATPNRFKMISGVNGLVWDTVSNQVVQIKNSNEYNVAKANRDLFLNIETSEEKENREMQEADSRKLSEDFRTEDYWRMGAIALDVAASVAAFVPTYGTATAGLLGLTSLGSNMAADIMDKSVTKGEVTTNALMNLGLGVVGLVPGLGAVGKGAKWLTQIIKWTPRILTLANAGRIALDDDVKASLGKALKVTEWSELSNHDVKNIAYALSVTAGLSRGANAIRTNRTYGTGLKGGTKTVEKVKTRSGKEIEISKEKLSEINKALSKGDEKGANKIFKAISDKTKGEELELETKYGIGGWKKPIVKKYLVKSSSVTTSTGVDRRAAAYQRALNIKNIRDRNSMPAFLRNSKIPITDYEIYNHAANLKVPELGLFNKAKRWWNPIKEGKFKSEGYTPSSAPESSSMSSRQLQFNQAAVNRYKEYAKGNFREKPINVTSEKPLEFKSNDFDFTISLNKGKNTYTLKFNKEIPGINTKHIKYKNLSLLKLREELMNIVRNTRVKVKSDGTKTKRSIEETGKLLQELKRKGVFNQGGRIDKQKIQKYRDFINK